MHSTSFIAAIPAVLSFLAVANAAPYTPAPAPSCPEGEILITEGCTSGFIGCVSAWNKDTVCNGERRFWNDCSAASWTGAFFNCANGFKGCTTKTTICDTPKVYRRTTYVVTPGSHPLCPSSTPLYYAEGQCSSNFIGCVDSARANTVCTGEKRFWSDCYNAPGLGGWQNCQWNNNFKGCINDYDVCAWKAPVTNPSNPTNPTNPPTNPGNNPTNPPTNPTKPTEPTKPTNPSPVDPSKVCKADETYYTASTCSSGFSGCAKQPGSVCNDTTKLAPQSCPSGYSYYNCGSGFKGCVYNDGRDVCGVKL